MIANREVVGPGRSPTTHLHVIVRRISGRYVGARNIRDHAQKRIQGVLQRGKRDFVCFHFVADAGYLSHHRGTIFSLAFQHPNLFGQRVALRLQLLGSGLQYLALVLKLAKLCFVEGIAASRQAGEDGGKFFA